MAFAKADGTPWSIQCLVQSKTVAMSFNEFSAIFPAPQKPKFLIGLDTWQLHFSAFASSTSFSRFNSRCIKSWSKTIRCCLCDKVRAVLHLGMAWQFCSRVTHALYQRGVNAISTSFVAISCQVHHISDIKRSLDQIDSVATHSRNPFCCTCSEPCNLLWNMANVAQNVLLCMDSTSITSIRLSARQRDRNAQNEWWTRTRPRDFAMALTLQQNVTRPRNHKKSRMHVDSRVTWN